MSKLTDCFLPVRSTTSTELDSGLETGDSPLKRNQNNEEIHHATRKWDGDAFAVLLYILKRNLPPNLKVNGIFQRREDKIRECFISRTSVKGNGLVH